MRKLGLLIVLIAAVVIAVVTWMPKSALVRAPKNTFHVAIADTDELQQKGLSGHDPLGEDGGMLFVFDWPAAYGFWMKDMKFPIDIVWIDSNKKVLTVDAAVDPSTYPSIYYPPSPAKYVLEVGANQAAAAGIQNDSQLHW